MGKDDLGLNQLGVPAWAHWVMFTCSQNQPGDWVVDEVEDVTCPKCLEVFAEMRRERLNRSKWPKSQL